MLSIPYRIMVGLVEGTKNGVQKGYARGKATITAWLYTNLIQAIPNGNKFYQMRLQRYIDITNSLNIVLTTRE